MRRREDHLPVYPYPHSGKGKARKPEFWVFPWQLQAPIPTEPGMFCPFSPGKSMSVIHTSVLQSLLTSGTFFPKPGRSQGFPEGRVLREGM